MVVEMTNKDYELQERRIWADDRYPFKLKQWMTMKLLERFREINHCFPHEVEDSVD